MEPRQRPLPEWINPGSASPAGGTLRPSSTGVPGAPAAAPGGLPEQLGRYRIIKKLGQGAMGSVYLAQDTHLDRPVALKVSAFTAENNPKTLERFHREAKAAAQFHHANLCPVYDVGQVDGVHYLCMAYIEGTPLAAALKRGQPWPQNRAVALVRRVASGLGYAHRLGVIHRDLKPSNIMLREDGDPVVVDFGLARRTDEDGTRLTRAGEVMGTPAYMPPEQVQGDVAAMGPGCDIYSLGVILYELLTGRLPFEGSVATILAGILTRQPRPPSALRPDLDARLDAICLTALAKRPADRFGSMDELAAALTDYLRAVMTGAEPPAVVVPSAPEPPAVVVQPRKRSARPAAPAPPRTSRSWWLAVVVAVAAVVALLAVLVPRQVWQGKARTQGDDKTATARVVDSPVGKAEPPEPEPPQPPVQEEGAFAGAEKAAAPPAKEKDDERPPPEPLVRDQACLFTAEAVANARAALTEFHEEYGKKVVIETLTLAAEDEQAVRDEGAVKVLVRVARDRAREVGADGLYILICRDLARVQLSVCPDAQSPFTADDRKAIIEKMTRRFRQAEYDEGLDEVVDEIEDAFKRHRAASGKGTKRAAPTLKGAGMFGD